MLSTFIQALLIFFAVIGAAFILWLLHQFIAAVGDARREMRRKVASTVSVEQPFSLAPYVRPDGKAVEARVILSKPYSKERHDELHADIMKQVEDIYSKKELDKDQADAHI